MAPRGQRRPLRVTIARIAGGLRRPPSSDADSTCRGRATSPGLELIPSTMACGHRVSVITKMLKQSSPQTLVEIDLASQRVRVETIKGNETIDSAVVEAGDARC